MSYISPNDINTVNTPLMGVNSAQTVSIPAGYSILQLIVEETAGQANNSGIKIGTTAGGTDVLNNYAIAANQLVAVSDSNLSKRIFSMTAATTLYVGAVLLFGATVLNIRFVLRKVN